MESSAQVAPLGALIERCRRRAGLTQESLAARSGMSVRALRDIERDRVRHPHAASLERLAAALGLSPAERAELLAVLDRAGRGRETTRVGVLGPLAVTRAGQPIGVATSAQRGLLGLLALQVDRAVSRDEIVETLWGPRPPKTAPAQVHAAVGRLRTILDPAGERAGAGGVLPLTHGRYRLSVPSDTVDVSRFAGLVAQAERHEPDEALRLLDEALRGWRGPVLADANARLRAHPAAAALGHQRLAAALRLADLSIELRRYAEATGPLRELTRDEPFHEGLHARLVLLLAGGGERAAALRLYAEVRARLVDELGVEPSQEMRAAHVRVLREEVPGPHEVVAASGRPSTVPAVPVVPALLPPDIPDFTGRAAEVDAAVELLTAPRPALVVAGVAGMGGVGKTAFAVHVAHLLAGAFPDGQLYANLRGIDPAPAAPIEVLARFLRALGVDSQAVPDDPVEASSLYRSRLNGRRVLVVLDNAAGEDQVRPLLPGSASCALVLTGRARLAGVEGARWFDLGDFPAGDALRLLAEVAGAERVAAEADRAAELVGLCGRLPLAVRVAGARLAARPRWRIAGLTALLADERRRLDRLAAGDLAVRASLALSYRGLDPVAARLLAMLGLFDAPDVPVWLAACLLEVPPDDAVEPLDALVDAQLLQLARTDAIGQVRYRLHDLVRLYARSLAPPEEVAGVLARGLGGWLSLAERMAPGVPGPCFAVLHGPADRTPVALPARVDPLAWFDAERSALLAAVAQACDHGLDDLAFDLAGTLEKYFDLRGMYESWRGTNERVMLLCRRTGNRLGEAVMLRGLAEVRAWNTTHADGGAMAGLEADGDRVRELFTAAGEPRGTADAEVMRAWGLAARGAYAEAVAAATRGLELATATGHLGGQARAHIALCLTYREQGRFAPIPAHLEAALSAARALGNPRYEAAVLQFTGIGHGEMGRLDEALAFLDESRAISERYRDHYAEALTMLAYARVHAKRGDDGRARSAAAASLALGREYNMTHHVADALAVLGELELAAGRPAEAVALLAESVRLWRTRGWPAFLAAALTALGAAQSTLDAAAARAAWEEARSLFAALGAEDRVAALDAALSR
ncbi:BTAD domain-containing putative transcriptional regulator [Dactylosporangium sp. AC04546]|uniref:BTAD domain-containing putative transcriptional regulator n=1 Tax=Dactylosporangium sp. AC04546 TaxID=2862460 RepID=UPI001EDE9D71|nr:BTAD domain-containing putative transcriptional regulator [Dactylosporangium sp. AC04546]WVK81870.1 BTAD domain-containing putative transcriptional regulator [Dactylosporangium sp. AC04546]